MSESTRYDKMINFFGVKNDKRVRLYLSILHDNYKKKLTFESCKLLIPDETGRLIIPEELKNKYYENRALNETDDEVNEEWDTFINNLHYRLANRTLNDISAPPNNVSQRDLIDIVRSLRGVYDPSDINTFFQVVVRKHCDVFINNEMGLTNVSDSPTNWNNINYIVFLPNFFRVIGITEEEYRTDIIQNVLPDSARDFSFKLSKYVLKSILERNANAITGEPDSFWTTPDIAENKYYRVSNNPTKLYTTGHDGNKLDVSMGSGEWNKLSSDKCMGTGVKENYGVTCADYISKCINSGDDNDIQSCKRFMQNTDFWDVTKREVSEMLPAIAIQTLDRLGFSIVETNDLTCYESVGAWLFKLKEFVPSQLTEEEFNHIKNNIKLTTYLTMLVTKINTNPAILNENYRNASVFNPADHDVRFNNWVLTKYGLTPRINYNNALLEKELNAMSSNLLSLRTIVSSRVGINPEYGLVVNGRSVIGMAIPRILVGGSNGELTLKPEFPRIRMMVDTLYNKLKSLGKLFDVNTQRQLDQHLAVFRNYEAKLHKAIRIVDKYVDMLEIYKQYDTNNLLTMDHLQKFVEARENLFDKTLGKQDSILNIITTVANLVNEALDKENVTNPISQIKHTRNI